MKSGLMEGLSQLGIFLFERARATVSKLDAMLAFESGRDVKDPLDRLGVVCGVVAFR